MAKEFNGECLCSCKEIIMGEKSTIEDLSLPDYKNMENVKRCFSPIRIGTEERGGKSNYGKVSS
jgi:hypothetical protein